MKAAVCNAVAAAALLAACILASDSFLAQSGRTLSVVVTLVAFAERDCARLLVAAAGIKKAISPLFDEDRDAEDDIAEEALTNGWLRLGAA